MFLLTFLFFEQLHPNATASTNCIGENLYMLKFI